eukprot:jgi/Chrzof1/11178/Cz05g27020.t1
MTIDPLPDALIDGSLLSRWTHGFVREFLTEGHNLIRWASRHHCHNDGRAIDICVPERPPRIAMGGIALQWIMI